MPRLARAALAVTVAAASLLPLAASNAGATRSASNGGDAASYWTPARQAAAIPRDLVVDHRGLGYLRRPDGTLQPHGHGRPAVLTAVPTGKPVETAKPGGGGGGGGGDTTAPVISNLNPAGEATIGASHTFSATVTDTGGSGVRSVTFVVSAAGGVGQSFIVSNTGGDTWSVTLQGFTNGTWSWYVVAKDNGAKGGNTAMSPTITFTVSTGGGGGGGGTDVVTNAPWTGGGAVQEAAGRIYFEMPTNRQKTRWAGYVCSGTVATDEIAGRAVIITAAHCVYDDVNKAFARGVLFIPNQDATGLKGGTGTDLNCFNDPYGCWEPSFGVVDQGWTSRTFPDNIPWDYGYYVVPDTGAHSGTAAPEDLETAVGSLPVQFSAPSPTAYTYALGYSYSDDPNFMHCAENMTTEGDHNWWLPSCELSGGSSGGPWNQPDGGNGPIISVNSWGYTTGAGMAGPKLTGTASCVFDLAKTTAFATAGDGISGC